MTKTNLIGILLAALLLTGFAGISESAYAKSDSKVAQVNNSIVIYSDPVLDKGTLSLGVSKSKPDKINSQWYPQKPKVGKVAPYMDTNLPKVWKGKPKWIRVFLSCVAEHESSHSPWAVYPDPSVSTASGKYQFLDSTWRGNAKWTKVRGKFVARQYARAVDAPAWVQEAVAIHAVERDGMLNWKGTGCGYGT
jgi:hypothetical protein